MTLPYEKVINDIINRKNEKFENAFRTAEKNFIIAILESIKEIAEEEAQKQQEQKAEQEKPKPIFYSEMPKKEAVALLHEILDKVDDAVMAAKLSRMFMNNRIPVDRIKALINNDLANKLNVFRK